MKIKINTGDRFFNAWAMLRRTADIIARARHKELVRYGITIRQASALHLIQMLGDQASPAEIARAELRQPHTVSAILKTMEDQGLIRRRKDLERLVDDLGADDSVHPHFMAGRGRCHRR